MISAAIPGLGKLEINHLVLDFNGTLATDGNVIPGVKTRLSALSKDVDVHILTADTFGTVRSVFEGSGYVVSVLERGAQDEAKKAYVRKLGAEHTAAIGNGRNDSLMIAEAALGIAIIGDECAAGTTLKSADVVAPDILAALDLLLNPLRLVATLRA